MLEGDSSRLTPSSALLTDWLRQNGSLTRGNVDAVHVDLVHNAEISTLTYVTVSYSSDAPDGLPRALVVKSPHAPRSTLGDGMGEPAFYQRVAPRTGSPPVVRCLAAIEDSADRREILVLEDLRATHDHPNWPLSPSEHRSRLAIAALAQLHARWFEAAELGDAVGKWPSRESLTSMVQGIAANLPAFWDALGPALPAETRRVYDRVFASSLAPWLRIADKRALTVVHGDAHTWNFLFPRSADGPAYLIDWQLWHIDVGARDLAFMIALHWYPSRRRELERPLLQYYLDCLRSHGVAGYDFEELLLDYRRCVVRNLTLPIIWWSRGMRPEAWWHRLECAVAAYRDLNCEELL